MTQPGIDPRSPGPLTNTLTIMPVRTNNYSTLDSLKNYCWINWNKQPEINSRKKSLFIKTQRPKRFYFTVFKKSCMVPNKNTDPTVDFIYGE